MKPIKNVREYVKSLVDSKFGEKMIRQGSPFAVAFNKAIATDQK